MIAELIFNWIREVGHYTKDVFEYEALHEVFRLLSHRGFAFSVFLLLELQVAFDVI